MVIHFRTSVEGGRVRAPFTNFALAPHSFKFFATCTFFTFFLDPFSFFYAPCSFLIFLLAPGFFSCSMLLFRISPCSFLSFLVLLAPELSFVCSLLLYLFYGLLLTPLCQVGLAPYAGITPDYKQVIL